jgi:peptidoglycan/LPS O-acetylase OafA/YrhL
MRAGLSEALQENQMTETHTDVKPSRLPELDGLRGLAILLVVIWHYAAQPANPTPGTLMAFLVQPFKIAWSGVDLFFVLSGFLIGGVLLDNKTSPRYFKTFYIRRICRIFPLYYFWIGLYLLIPIILDHFQLGAQPTFFHEERPTWPYLFFVQNIAMAKDHYWGPVWVSPTWSLAIEEQFYIVLPLMIRFLPVRFLPWVLGGLILLAVVLRHALYVGFENPGFYGYLLLPCRADALLLGVLCAWALRQDEIRSILTRSRRPLVWIGVLLAIGVMALAYGSPQVFSPVMNVYGFTWVALFYAVLLLVVVLNPDGVAAAIFRYTPLRRLGMIAYGVYLIHEVMLKVTFDLSRHLSQPFYYAAGQARLSLISLVATLLVAQLLWVSFEKRVIDYGHSYKY